MTIKEKLLAIQAELKAPKNQYNDYGKYNYRSCEDILEALKPLLAKHKALLTISDGVEMVGDRYYIKATVTLSSLEPVDGTQDIKDYVAVNALAREPLSRKGMDESQITGTSSSYARKYALNALFLIDDVKDADATNKGQEQPTEQPKNIKATPNQLKIINAWDKARVTAALSYYKVEKAEDLTIKQASEIVKKINKEKEANNDTKKTD